MELPEPGDVFEGRYAVTAVIGEGGFARVLRARDTKMERDVALKITFPGDEKYYEQIAPRFLREAAVLADLQDPYTVTLYDFGASEDGLLYMAFEFIDGDDLAGILKRGPLDARAVEHILQQVLSSLREAHARDVLHRDIKPTNVMVYEYAGDPLRIKLLDFGIAKPMKSSTATAQLTQSGTMVGTPRYMAPEQILGEALSPATDLYCVGLVAFELLTGRPAIDATSQREILHRTISDEPFVLPDHVAPRGLRRVIERMLARAPNKRYAQADDVREALQACHSELRDWTPPPPRQPGPTAADARPPTVVAARAPKRDPRIMEIEPDHRPLTAVAVLAVLVIGVVALAFAFRGEAPEPPPAPREPTVRDTSKLIATPDPPPPPAATGPAPASVAAPHGGGLNCTGKTAYEPGFRTLRRLRGLSKVEVDVLIPPDYDPGRRYPLIALYHDVGQTPLEALRALDLESVADVEPFIVLAPASKAGIVAWRAPGDWEESLNAIEVAHDELCLDPRRTFVFGHGIGGVAGLAAMCAGSAAAVATVGFLPEARELEQCEPKAGAPYLSVIGRDDPYAPRGGGQNCAMREVLSLDATQAVFQKRHACIEGQPRRSKHGRSSCATWECSAPYVSCVAHGGHSAGTLLEVGECASEKPLEFPLTRTVWQFFSATTRPP